MRIIFVNRFFWPDVSATSQILTDLATHLAEEGEEVVVVTSALRYDDPTARLAPSDRHLGVDVRRVWTSRLGRGSLPARILDYVTFYISAFWTLLVLAGRGDIIVAKTDPPLIGVAVAAAAGMRGARTVQWVQDLYPETASAFGVLPKSGLLVGILKAVRGWSLRASAASVAIGARMAERLADAGADPAKIHVIENWVDEAFITPVARAENRLRRDWGLGGRFVLAYSGNLGRAHDVSTLLDALGLLRPNNRPLCLFIGGGHGMEALRSEIAQRGLDDCIRFKPYQPQDMLRFSLGVADLHWVSLKPQLEGLIVPSKVYGILAAGRPLIMIGDPDGEVGRLVRAYDCGVCVKPDESERLASTLTSLMQDPDRVHKMGQRARAAAEGDASRLRALAKWRDVLSRCRAT